MSRFLLFFEKPRNDVCRCTSPSLLAVGGWLRVPAIDSSGRTMWIVDAHRGDGQRFIVRADGKLTAFV
jgi:hypothetical protein